MDASANTIRSNSRGGCMAFICVMAVGECLSLPTRVLFYIYTLYMFGMYCVEYMHNYIFGGNHPIFINLWYSRTYGYMSSRHTTTPQIDKTLVATYVHAPVISLINLWQTRTQAGLKRGQIIFFSYTLIENIFEYEWYECPFKI